MLDCVGATASEEVTCLCVSADIAGAKTASYRWVGQESLVRMTAAESHLEEDD